MGKTRADIMKRAGEIVKVEFKGSDNQENFLIGWFYGLIDDTVRLKVTSTKHESYESINIPVDRVTDISNYQVN